MSVSNRFCSGTEVFSFSLQKKKEMDRIGQSSFRLVQCKKFVGWRPRTQVACNGSAGQQEEFTGTIVFNGKTVVLVARDFNLPSSTEDAGLSPYYQ